MEVDWPAAVLDIAPAMNPARKRIAAVNPAQIPAL